MSEKNVSAVAWMHGLQEYFEFKGNTEVSDICADFLKIMYSENKAPTLRNALMKYIEQLPSDSQYNYINFFTQSANPEENLKLKEISSALALLFPEESVFFGIKKFYRTTDLDLSDVYSRGQVQSKIWLVTELEKIKNEFNNIAILAGWYGQLVKYFKNIKYNNIRIVEIDRQACLISDDVFNLDLIEGYKVKSVCTDINLLNLTKKGYELHIENFKNQEQKKFSQQFYPDLIINTSAEHMTDEWYDHIRFKDLDPNPIVVIQSNNLFEIEEHVNCVHSIDHMKKKYPMTNILYEGELQLHGYKRVMLIGRP